MKFFYCFCIVNFSIFFGMSTLQSVEINFSFVHSDEGKSSFHMLAVIEKEKKTAESLKLIYESNGEKIRLIPTEKQQTKKMDQETQTFSYDNQPTNEISAPEIQPTNDGERNHAFTYSENLGNIKYGAYDSDTNVPTHNTSIIDNYRTPHIEVNTEIANTLKGDLANNNSDEQDSCFSEFSGSDTTKDDQQSSCNGGTSTPNQDNSTRIDTPLSDIIEIVESKPEIKNGATLNKFELPEDRPACCTECFWGTLDCCDCVIF